MKSLGYLFGKRKLRNLYVARRFSTIEISKLYRCSEETIRNYLIKFKIKRRRDAPRYIRTVKRLTKTQTSYFAGIIDGEGTITIAKSNRSIGGITPLVSVKNTDKKLINWLLKNVGCKVSEYKPRNERWKLSYRWYTYSVSDVYEIIRMIYPYLIIKKNNAKKVLAFCKWRIKISRKSRKNPIIYPRESDGNFSKAKRIIYDNYNSILKIAGGTK